MGQQLSSNIHDNYHLQKVKLGQGSFGTVWRAVHRKTGESVAVKQLCKANLPSLGIRREDVDREISLLGSLEHENIIKLHQTFEDGESIFMAFEYCDGGDFGDKVLERGSSVQEPEVVFWVKQMLGAIAYMHERHICHRDIKPDNFLVANKDTLKLADLGLAMVCPRSQLVTQKCGTPAYMAPEQHLLPALSKGYAFPVDVWAAGVCMYVLMFGGRHPFLGARNDLNLKQLLAGSLNFSDRSGMLGTVGLAGEHMSAEARGLCQHMVTVDPLRRITAQKALGVLGVAQRVPSSPAAGAGAVVRKKTPSAGLREQVKQRLSRSIGRAVSKPKQEGAVLLNRLGALNRGMKPSIQ